MSQVFSKNKQKLAKFIKLIEEKYPPRQIYLILKINRNTYYRWLKLYELRKAKIVLIKQIIKKYRITKKYIKRLYQLLID